MFQGTMSASMSVVQFEVAGSRCHSWMGGFTWIDRGFRVYVV
jgi:hypothetical protein